jgi:non-heme chloroperoxidase
MAHTRTAVVFIHGLWLHSSSWQPWLDLFSSKGYAPIAPGWPNESETVAAARAHLQAVAGIGVQEATEHFAAIIAQCRMPPVIIGHCYGGLIAQKLLARSVAIGPAGIKGTRQFAFAQVRSGLPAMRYPLNRKRAVSLTANQFRYSVGNAIERAESVRLFEAYSIPSPARPAFEASFANMARRSPTVVNTQNPDRGPLLLISGQKDHMVPDVVTRATYKLYGESTAVTDLKQLPDRGHSLPIDHRWHQIADFVLGWLIRRGVSAVAPSGSWRQ